MMKPTKIELPLISVKRLKRVVLFCKEQVCSNNGSLQNPVFRLNINLAGCLPQRRGGRKGKWNADDLDFLQWAVTEFSFLLKHSFGVTKLQHIEKKQNR